MVDCLNCGAEIDMTGKKAGNIIVCYECGQDWKIVGQKPNLGIEFPAPDDEDLPEDDDDNEWEI